MANKRIELEQCKQFINLQDEYPTRKRVRQGIFICLLCAVLLAFAFLVLGFLSNDLAQNPANILEQPPEAPVEMPEEDMLPQDFQQMPQQMPEGFEIPGNEQLPEGFEIPGNEQMPEGITPPPIPESALPSHRATAAAAGTGALLAQAEPTVPAESEIPVIEPEPQIPVQDMSVPGEFAPVDSAPDGETEQHEGPGPETTGVGNLANLANKISGRGFQLYLLVLSVALMVIFYLGIRIVRREGKIK